ncbi:sterol carrier protein [Halomarina salina]|uniref:Sterol carrier protein n=1 Tax=Halomarina salina TaxID=1872699 RepID=A0ABD5RIC7_9EURY|nr:hypothetical protein [Halomarina salina]
MSEWFPSEEWLDRYRANLNESERYAAESDGWGVDFAGDFVFEIRSLPVEETTVGEFPDDLTDDLRENLTSLPDERAATLVADAPPTLRERLDEQEGDDRTRLLDALLATPVAEVPDAVSSALREELPADLANLLTQLERYVDDGTVRVYLDLYEGECREAFVLDPDDERDPGFALQGPYGSWKALTEGEDVMDSVLGQDLDLDGSVTKIMSYADAADEMGDVASRTDSRALFQGNA